MSVVLPPNLNSTIYHYYAPYQAIDIMTAGTTKLWVQFSAASALDPRATDILFDRFRTLMGRVGAIAYNVSQKTISVAGAQLNADFDFGHNLCAGYNKLPPIITEKDIEDLFGPAEQTMKVNSNDPDFQIVDDKKYWWMKLGLCPVCKDKYIEKPKIQPGGFFECPKCKWRSM